MAGAERSVTLNVLARMNQYKKQMMSELPGISEKAASSAAMKMQAQFMREEQKRLQQARKSAQKQADTYRQTMSAAFSAVAALGIGMLVKQVVDFTQGIQDAKNDINDLGNAVGISNKLLQTFAFAARTSGGGLQELAPSLKQFPKRMDDFARGTGEASSALIRLGFSSTEMKKRLEAGEDVTADIVNALQEVENTGQRAAFATMIFGEAGVRLVQVLGSGTLDQWVEMTERYALDVGPAAVDASARWEAASAMLEGKFMRLADAILMGTEGTSGFIRAAAVAVGAMDTLRAITVLSTSVWGAFVKRISFAAIALKALTEGDFTNAMSAMEAAAEVTVPKLGAKIARVFTAGSEGAQEFLADLDLIMAGSERTARVLEKLPSKMSKTGGGGGAGASAQITSPFDSDVFADIEAAEKALGEFGAKAVEDQRSAVDVIRDGWAGTFEAIDEMVADGLVTAEMAGETRLAVEARVQREILELHRQTQQEQLTSYLGYTEQIASATFDLLDQLLILNTNARAAELEAETTQLDTLKQRRQAAKDREAELVLEMEEIKSSGRNAAFIEERLLSKQAAKMRAVSRQEDLTGEIKLQGKKTRRARKALLKAAKAEKKSAVFSIAISTLVAATKALAELGPIAGPIAAAAITASGIASGIAAASKPLPSFFRGGVRRDNRAGEAVALVHDGEAVLNRRAVSNLGPEVVDAINRGFSGASMGGGATYIDGEEVASRMSARVRRAGTLRTAVTEAGKDGRRLVYRG